MTSILLSRSMVRRQHHFNGNSFDVDGNPHDINGNPIAGPAAPAFSIINNNPGSDATTAVTSTLGALSNPQEDNITGDGPDPSVQDTTDDVRNDPDPDAENIFDPTLSWTSPNGWTPLPTSTSLPVATVAGESPGAPSAVPQSRIARAT